LATEVTAHNFHKTLACILKLSDRLEEEDRRAFVVKYPGVVDFAGISIVVSDEVKVVTGLGRGQV
jgi:hypothetical protein